MCDRTASVCYARFPSAQQCGRHAASMAQRVDFCCALCSECIRRFGFPVKETVLRSLARDYALDISVFTSAHASSSPSSLLPLLPSLFATATRFTCRRLSTATTHDEMTQMPCQKHDFFMRLLSNCRVLVANDRMTRVPVEPFVSVDFDDADGAHLDVSSVMICEQKAEDVWLRCEAHRKERANRILARRRHVGATVNVRYDVEGKKHSQWWNGVVQGHRRVTNDHSGREKEHI